MGDYVGAFEGCSWCGGRGCNQCSHERKAAQKAFNESFGQPIATFKTDDPKDMDLAREAIGREALQKAFGPNGGGVQEIKRNCAIATIKQLMRKSEAEQHCRTGG